MGLPVTCTSAVAAELGFDDEDGVHVDARSGELPPPRIRPRCPQGTDRELVRPPRPLRKPPGQSEIACPDPLGLKPGQIRGATAGGLRGWSQARRAFPAGMKRSVQSRHFKPCGAMVGAMWGWNADRPPRIPRNRRRAFQAPDRASLSPSVGSRFRPDAPVPQNGMETG